MKVAEQIRQPLMSGLCAFPQTINPEESHARCTGGQRANPENMYQPCNCRCHLAPQRYECDGCGGVLAEAPLITAVTGEDTYVHMREDDKRWTSEFCS